MRRAFDFAEALKEIKKDYPTMKFRRFRVYCVDGREADVTVAYLDVGKTRTIATAFRAPIDKYIEAKGRYMAASRLIHPKGEARGQVYRMTRLDLAADQLAQIERVIKALAKKRETRWMSGAKIVL